MLPVPINVMVNLWQQKVYGDKFTRNEQLYVSLTHWPPRDVEVILKVYF